ncbi:hypothetical protein VOLCADRAFT_97528 [Volvox carteri f. nagariensis]|uniref:Uncharacterized protein n=1 Tax=Volvox carteri f. nagariensis TaxID=3068 RepID=D8UCZ0_VOLCA|nr:uncharacterized protein VOLCADRAFT_97528 [Volvox carteri f. nagariensis]EFJ42475.1 hypothetical protein VOLCADRAFT_97528 [Volvox carteri f. nagariensis]|eukprot:XP_002956538.1 hypothetical protein VOLCADRAFT_97528 [Volvox carteri f. nagariensis]
MQHRTFFYSSCVLGQNGPINGTYDDGDGDGDNNNIQHAMYMQVRRCHPKQGEGAVSGRCTAAPSGGGAALKTRQTLKRRPPERHHRTQLGQRLSESQPAYSKENPG